MPQKFYIYDTKIKDWVETHKEWCMGDIEHRAKKLIDSSKEKQEVLEGVLAAVADLNYFMEHNAYENRLDAAVRWRLQYSDKMKTVIIIGDVCIVNVSISKESEKEFNSYWYNEDGSINIEAFLARDVNRINYDRNFELLRRMKQLSLRLNYDKWNYVAIPGERNTEAYWGRTVIDRDDWTLDESGIHAAVPDVVIRDAYDILKKYAEEEFGFEPTVPLKYLDAQLLKKYVCYPLDVNVADFMNIFDFSFGAQIVRKNDDNFELVCEYMNIEPSKSIKKAYHENGSSLLVIHYLRKYLNIEDVNVWQLFFDCKKLLGKKYNQLIIDKQGDIRIIIKNYSWQIIGEIFSETEQLKRYYDWAAEKWGTKLAGQQIRAVIEGVSREQSDLLSMLDYVEYDIPDDIVKCLHQTGLSHEAHELMNEENEKVRKRKRDEKRQTPFKLTKTDLSRECIMKKGKIVAAKNGSELWEISSAMHNCVYTYDTRIENGECTIYTYQRDEMPLVCIEVQNSVIVQVYGICNEPIYGELLDEVKDWAVLNDIEFKPIY